MPGGTLLPMRIPSYVFLHASPAVRSASSSIISNAATQCRTKTTCRHIFSIQHRLVTQALSNRTSLVPSLSRSIHITQVNREIVQFNLSDIGEGIKEVTVKVRNEDFSAIHLIVTFVLQGMVCEAWRHCCSVRQHLRGSE